LSDAFFIALSFSSAGAPGADDADIITPFRMHDNQQFPLMRMAKHNQAVFRLGMGNL
jgi:hypothetical protein